MSLNIEPASYGVYEVHVSVSAEDRKHSHIASGEEGVRTVVATDLTNAKAVAARDAHSRYKNYNRVTVTISDARVIQHTVVLPAHLTAKKLKKAK